MSYTKAHFQRYDVEHRCVSERPELSYVLTGVGHAGGSIYWKDGAVYCPHCGDRLPTTLNDPRFEVQP